MNGWIDGCQHLCTHVSTHQHTPESMDMDGSRMDGRMDGCVYHYASMHACTYVQMQSMYDYLHVLMYLRMSVCQFDFVCWYAFSIYLYVCAYVCTVIQVRSGIESQGILMCNYTCLNMFVRLYV